MEATHQVNYKGHLLVGSLTTVILTAIFYFTTNLIHPSIQTLIMVAIIAYVFSLLPDIDHRSGTITWNFLGIGIIGITIAILNNYLHFLDNSTPIMIASVVLLILTFVCAKFAGHRGIIHTVRAGAAFSLAFYFVADYAILCLLAFAAYYSHLVADGLWSKL